jgi:hypothetical protein
MQISNISPLTFPKLCENVYRIYNEQGIGVTQCVTIFKWTQLKHDVWLVKNRLLMLKTTAKIHTE